MFIDHRRHCHFDRNWKLNFLCCIVGKARVREIVNQKFVNMLNLVRSSQQPRYVQLCTRQKERVSEAAEEKVLTFFLLFFKRDFSSSFIWIIYADSFWDGWMWKFQIFHTPHTLHTLFFSSAEGAETEEKWNQYCVWRKSGKHKFLKCSQSHFFFACIRQQRQWLEQHQIYLSTQLKLNTQQTFQISYFKQGDREKRVQLIRNLLELEIW